MEIKKLQPRNGVVSYIISGRYRIQIFSESFFRVEYSGAGVFDEEYPLVTGGGEGEEEEPAFHSCHDDKSEAEIPHSLHTNKIFSIKTKYFHLEILPDGKPLDIGNFRVKIFHSLNGDVVFEPGVEDKENLGGAYLDLYKYPAGKIWENFTPGLISPNGYFVWRNHCEFLKDKSNGWIKKRADSSDFQDWFIFAYGSDYKRAFGDFIAVFGRIPMIPRWALGYWYSRWHKFHDYEIIETIKKFRSLGISPDVFVIDTDWRKHGWNGYEWNKEFFPEPERFISELKSLGVRCCLNDHPGYGVSDELPSDDPYRDEIKKEFPDVKDYRVYWNDERYVNAWINRIFAKILKDGIDFWWVDGWGASGGIMDLHSQFWLNKFYFESARRAGDARRPMILSRWGGIGSHRYPVQFSGDTYSTFETIKKQISFTHKGGNIGAAWWSHDIGGFLGGKIDEELFIRWVEFGCFSPIFRTHSSGAPRDVWNYSARAIDIFKKYTSVRQSLKPYLYTLARETFETGLPLVRGLYIENPRDPDSHKSDEEYLIGSKLLVAPAYGPGEVFRREVYFPTGVWAALEDIDIIKGKCRKFIDIPIDRIPIFLKRGAIIPSAITGSGNTPPSGDIEFLVFPSVEEEGSDFDYYEDDGNTEEYLSGAFARRKIEARLKKNIFPWGRKKVEIKIHPCRGSYKGMPDRYNISVVIFVPELKGASPSKIFVNGLPSAFEMTENIFSGSLKTPWRSAKIQTRDVLPSSEILIEARY